MRPMRLVPLLWLLLVVAGSLSPVGAAYAHAGHQAAVPAAHHLASAHAAPVLRSGSHCPSDSGHCCCEADRCAGLKPSRGAAMAPAATLPSPDPAIVALHVRTAIGVGVPAVGAPDTTRLARAPPDLP